MRTIKTFGFVVACLTILLLSVAGCGSMPEQTLETVQPSEENLDLKTLRQDAEQGDAGAQSILGVMYATGEGVPQDYREAVKWSRLAADQGNAGAQYNLGWMYTTGEGVAQDSREAVKWYRLAADQGYAVAQHNLGVIYATGEGVAQDYREAEKWSRLAADQGLAGAQYNLGWMYTTGEGVAQDSREAVKWYRLAADQGNASAQSNLGVMYEHGKGVAQDSREAVKWYRLAADQGYAVAQHNLSVMYTTGKGVAQDSREAVKWSRLAADQDYAVAQHNLGVMYAKGEGVAQDSREAAKWSRLAADQGLAVAQASLGARYHIGDGVIQDNREAFIWASLAAMNGEENFTKLRDFIAKPLSSDERLAAQAEAKRRLKAIEARPADKASETEIPNMAFIPITPITPPAPQQSAAQRAFEHGWRSVVVLTTSDGQGSGVIIRPNVVATNCHVVEGDGDIAVYKAENHRANTDAPHSARIRLADRKRDLCLLDVSELWGVPAQIREAKSLSIGEAVYAIGAPHGLDFSLSAGVVSQLRTDTGDAPVIQTDAAISPGSSGGGLFDTSGNLVGITTRKISDGEITFAIPTEWILEMR